MVREAARRRGSVPSRGSLRAPPAASRCDFTLKTSLFPLNSHFKRRFLCLFPRGGCEARPSRPPPPFLWPHVLGVRGAPRHRLQALGERRGEAAHGQQDTQQPPPAAGPRHRPSAAGRAGRQAPITLRRLLPLRSPPAASTRPAPTEAPPAAAAALPLRAGSAADSPDRAANC